VNVKLRSNLDRADEILAKLRKLTVVNSKLAYTTLAWGNRFGAPKAADKQRILDEMDDQLAAMDVGIDERAEIRRSYVRFIVFDFYYLFIRSIDYALSRRGEELQARNGALPSDPNRAAMQEFNVNSSEWRGRVLGHASPEGLPIAELRKYMHDAVPLATFSAEETTALNKIADEIADFCEAAQKKGGYTTEAAEFYDRYSADGMGASLYRRIFTRQ
jgi:hypothetical protein